MTQYDPTNDLKRLDCLECQIQRTNQYLDKLKALLYLIQTSEVVLVEDFFSNWNET
jgi:hypothetical protein